MLGALIVAADGGGLPVLAKLLDSAAFSVAVFERDPDVRVAYVNQAAATHAVVGREKAVGTRVEQVFPQVDPAFIAQLRREGMITSTRSRITILDPVALRRAAGDVA